MTTFIVRVIIICYAFLFLAHLSKCRITCTVNKVTFINSPLTVAMKSGQFWGFKSIISDTNRITSQQGIFMTFLLSTNCVCVIKMK